MITYLMDPLIYQHSTGGLLFNKNLNYKNLIFNVIVAISIITIITFILIWQEKRYQKNNEHPFQPDFSSSVLFPLFMNKPSLPK